MTRKINVATIKEIAVAAGKAILEVYHDADFSKVVNFKADDSPLTFADEASHHVIVPALQKHYP